MSTRMGSRNLGNEADRCQQPDLGKETLQPPNTRRTSRRERGPSEEDGPPIAKRTRRARRLAPEASDNAGQAGPEPTFPLLGGFPREIQLLIWECVPAVRRVVSIWDGHVIVEEGQSVAPNPITQVCKAARKATKKRVIYARRPVVRFSGNLHFVPFDFDTVWDVGRLTGVARLMQEHLFPQAPTPFYVALPQAFEAISELKVLSPIPWEMLQTVVIGTGLTWETLGGQMSDGKKEKMKRAIRTLFPKAKRIFITSHVDLVDPKSENINLKLMHADEIPVLEEQKKIEFKVEGVENQISTVRKLGDGPFFLEGRYIPDEEDPHPDW